MNRVLSAAAVALVAIVGSCPAGEPVRVTVVLCGVASTDDVPVLLNALDAAEGVTIPSGNVSPGFRKFNNRFSTPLVVKIAPVPGSTDANIGKLAAVAKKAETSDPTRFPPGINLLLYTDDQLTEKSIAALRSALSSVNGVDVNRPGGLGANLAEGWCWIRLESAGGAMLHEIETKAARCGLKLRRLRNAD